MGEKTFTEDLLKHHESAGTSRLFNILVDSMAEDEELYETHMNINGNEDFRLEVEEGVEGDVRSISVSVYRVVAGEHVISSITAQVDYEQRGAYYSYPEETQKMSIADVYSEIMDMIRKIEKVKLE